VRNDAEGAYFDFRGRSQVIVGPFGRAGLERWVEQFVGPVAEHAKQCGRADRVRARRACRPLHPRSPSMTATSSLDPHRTVADLVATSDYRVPADGCASYEALYARLAHLEADTHLHIHLESDLLFPAVTRSA
jgi:hypothetical protein